VTATLQLSRIFENRILNLEFCCRKTVICRFRPSKQQLFAADRSIDSDDASSRPLTSGGGAQRPIAHKSETNSGSSLSPILAGGYSTTRATLRTSFKVKGQGHKLTSSVRLIYNNKKKLRIIIIITDLYSGKQNVVPVSLKAGGGIPCRPNPAATPCHICM